MSEIRATSPKLQVTTLKLIVKENQKCMGLPVSSGKIMGF